MTSQSVVGCAAEAIRPSQRQGVQTYCAAEEIVLYDRSTDAVVALNLTAAAIWELCDGVSSIGDIVAELSQVTGEPSDGIAGDVERAVRELHALNLVVLSGDHAGE